MYVTKFLWDLAQSLEIGTVGDKQKQLLPNYHRYSYTPSMLAVDRGCVLFRIWLMGVASIALCVCAYTVVAEVWFSKRLMNDENGWAFA